MLVGGSHTDANLGYIMVFQSDKFTRSCTHFSPRLARMHMYAVVIDNEICVRTCGNSGICSAKLTRAAKGTCMRTHRLYNSWLNLAYRYTPK